MRRKWQNKSYQEETAVISERHQVVERSVMLKVGNNLFSKKKVTTFSKSISASIFVVVVVVQTSTQSVSHYIIKRRQKAREARFV